ncbi:GGDEF domain-containing protein [Paenibacillus gansuensis]|uniref:GGDEF domain-containing protein n=1 Tax=Paenibacillus gansuensis TaxID=306542 RepID=A0ABW5P6X0_9BACL
MIKDLFINFSLMISLLFLASQLYRWKRIEQTSLFTKQLLAGFIAGILGNVLMQNAISVTDSVLVDMRIVPIAIIALHAGFLPGLLTFALIAGGRILFFPLHYVTLIAVVHLLLMLLAGYVLSKWKTGNWTRFFCLLTFWAGTSFFSLWLAIGSLDKVASFYGIYVLLVFTCACLSYYLLLYFQQSHLAIERFKEHATRDFLTGVNNVRMFDEAFNNSISWADRRGEKLSLLLLDIDHFKKINDTYGHLTGDEVLHELGILLPGTARPFDTVSRNGGEEFTVLLPDCPHPQAMEVGERIRRAVEKHEFLHPSGGDKLRITVSIGVSTYGETAYQPELVYKEADEAMYLAKKSGRNQVRSLHI